MISLAELNKHSCPTTPEIDANLNTLLSRLNAIREAFGKPMIVTSGLRDETQQNALIAQGKSNAKKSKHLIGAAADIYDASGEFYDWCQANEKLLEEVGLWCENRQGPWQHLQIFPPASGHRWFIP
jgi:hypothetical protein